MKSVAPGKSTSKVELSNLSIHGAWFLIHEREYFLPFDQYPWFRDATIAQIAHVELLHDTHLYWQALDVDLSLAILEDPGRFPLIARCK